METLARIVIYTKERQIATIGLNYKGPVVKIVVLENDHIQYRTVDFLQHVWVELQTCANLYEVLPSSGRPDAPDEVTNDESIE